MVDAFGSVTAQESEAEVQIEIHIVGVTGEPSNAGKSHMLSVLLRLTLGLSPSLYGSRKLMFTMMAPTVRRVHEDPLAVDIPRSDA